MGVDSSKEMVDQATSRNAKAIEAGRVELAGGLCRGVAIRGQNVRWRTRSQLHAGLAGCLAGLREIRRVMKPGGRIALAFTRHSGQPKSGVADLLTAAGF